jgi:hypothetical protein
VYSCWILCSIFIIISIIFLRQFLNKLRLDSRKYVSSIYVPPRRHVATTLRINGCQTTKQHGWRSLYALYWDRLWLSIEQRWRNGKRFTKETIYIYIYIIHIYIHTQAIFNLHVLTCYGYYIIFIFLSYNLHDTLRCTFHVIKQFTIMLCPSEGLDRRRDKQTHKTAAGLMGIRMHTLELWWRPYGALCKNLNVVLCFAEPRWLNFGM